MSFIAIRKSVIALSVSLLTVLSLAGCSSNPSRDVAQEPAHQDAVSKIQDNEYAPHKFHDKRFERNNQY